MYHTIKNIIHKALIYCSLFVLCLPTFVFADSNDLVISGMQLQQHDPSEYIQGGQGFENAPAAFNTILQFIHQMLKWALPFLAIAFVCYLMFAVLFNIAIKIPFLKKKINGKAERISYFSVIFDCGRTFLVLIIAPRVIEWAIKAALLVATILINALG